MVIFNYYSLKSDYRVCIKWWDGCWKLLHAWQLAKSIQKQSDKHKDSDPHLIISLLGTVFNHYFCSWHHCSQHFALTSVMSGFKIGILLYIWVLWNYFLTLILNLDTAAALISAVTLATVVSFFDATYHFKIR